MCTQNQKCKYLTTILNFLRDAQNISHRTRLSWVERSISCEGNWDYKFSQATKHHNELLKMKLIFI